MRTPGFPPLTRLDEYPLHPEGVYGNQLWACQRPLTPRDGTPYDWRCRRCVDEAQAHVLIEGDVELWWKRSKDDEPEPVQTSWLVARSLYWFASEEGETT